MAFSLRESDVLRVRAAATGNVDISTALVNAATLDGLTLATGDWVLCYSQTDPIQNGLYRVAASGAAPRANVMLAGTNAVSVRVYVNEGDAHEGRSFVQTANPAVVGTDALIFERVFSAGSLTGPSYRRAQTTGLFSLTTDSTWTDVTGLTVTIPEAGTWRVGYDVHGSIANNSTTDRYFKARLHDGTSFVSGSERNIAQQAATGFTPTGIGSASFSTFVTTTGAKTFKVQAHETGGNVNLHGVVDTGSAIFFEPVAQDLVDPNLVQPTDLRWVEVSRSTSQTTVSLNSPLQFTAVDSGDASLYNTGTFTFTLPAGRWKLTAGIERLNGSAATTEVGYGWYNTTAGAWVGSTASIGVQSSINFGGVAQAIVDLTGTTTFQARISKSFAITNLANNSQKGIYASVEQLPAATMVRADSMTPVTLGYLTAERTAGQTTGVTAGSPVVFTSVTNNIGSTISLNTTTGRITLQPGTYRLSANPGSWIPSGNARPAFQWYNFSDSSYLGQPVSSYMPSDGSVHAQAGGPAEVTVVLTGAKDFEFRLRTIGNGTITQIGGSADPGTAVYPSVVVQQLPASTVVQPDALTPQPLVVVNGSKTVVQTGVGTGTDITLDSTVVQGPATTNGTGQWTLPAGTYELSGSIYANVFSDTTGGLGVISLVDSANTPIARGAVVFPTTRSASAASTNTTLGGVFTLAATTTVKLRCIDATGTFSAANLTAVPGGSTGVTIKQLPMSTITYVDGGIDPLSHFEYSAVEHATGETWVDGRPIYRKYFDVSAVANGATLIAGGIVDRLIDQFGQANTAGGAYLSIPMNDGANIFRAQQVVASGLVTLSRAGVFATLRSGEWLCLTFTKL